MPKLDYMYYLQLNIQPLNTALRKLLLLDGIAIKKTLSDLKSSERYLLDFKFSLIIDIITITSQLYNGENNQYFFTIDNVFQRAINCEDDYIIFEACTRLAGAYSQIKEVDKAVECYMTIIQKERDSKNITINSAIANHNIGALYLEYNDLELAIKYIHNAHQILTQHKIDSFEKRSFYLFNVANLSIHYFSANQVPKGIYFYNLATKIFNSNLATNSIISYENATISYYCFQNNFKNMQHHYQKLVAILIANTDYSSLVTLTLNFCNLAQTINADKSIILMYAIKVIEITRDKNVNKDIQALYTFIIDYYITCGEKSFALPYIQELATHLNTINSEIINQNAKLIDMHYVNKHTQKLDFNSKQEHQLETLYKENMEKTQHIKDMYSRLELIADIGKKITLSKSIIEVGQTVYTMLKDRIIIDNFYLATINEQEKELNILYSKCNTNSSLIHTNSSELKRNIPQSLITKSEFVFTNNVHMDSNFKKLSHNILTPHQEINSVIFVPIKFHHKVISIVIIEAKLKNAYISIHPELIKQLSTFLAISINNVIREEKLKKVIQERKEKQSKLAKLNYHLMHLSQKDELTQVDNHRTFKQQLPALVEYIRDQKLLLNIYMIDLDYFKAYNDSYGHLEGDEALKIIASTLSKSFLSNHNLFARYGGEEFIAVDFSTEVLFAKQKSANLCKVIEQLQLPNKASPLGHITISVGAITVNPTSLNRNMQYINDADSMLYQAKKNGRNTATHKLLTPDN